MSPSFTTQITFGDCDPAGIVYYPNTFRWMDATFHKMLRAFGGHAALCEALGSVGLGLIDASAQFKSPLRDGDDLSIYATVTDWGNKAVTIAYEGRVGDRCAFKGNEVRCIFTRTESGMIAGDMTKLRDIMEG